MRNMNVGDLAFFYASNCKEPGIMGTMEIVKEFSEDSKQPSTFPMDLLTLRLSIRTATRRALLRSQVDQGEAHLGSRACRVPKEVCRSDSPQGASRAWKAWWAFGGDAAHQAVETQRDQGQC